MTVGEILTSYKQAKDKSKQITILAELNAATKEDIIQVLKDASVSGKQLPRSRRTVSVDTSEGHAKTTVRSSVSSSSRPSKDSAISYIKDLQSRKSELLHQVELIDKELREISLLISCAQRSAS